MDLKGKLIEFIHTNKIDKDKRSGNKTVSLSLFEDEVCTNTTQRMVDGDLMKWVKNVSFCLNLIDCGFIK